MVSQRTLTRAVSAFTGALLCFAGLTSCGAVYNLYAPPGATIHSSLPGNYENPDNYRAPESERKIYVATKTFSPPKPGYETSTLYIPMVNIEIGDTWTVTHRIQNRLVIFSEGYQARQERALAGKGNYLYSLLIDSSGRVNKGWFLLKDPKLVVLTSERFTVMDPSIRDTDGWPEEPVFAIK